MIIPINVKLHNPTIKQVDTDSMRRLSIAIHTMNTWARNITTRVHNRSCKINKCIDPFYNFYPCLTAITR